jgi:hypothetical protein
LCTALSFILYPCKNEANDAPQDSNLTQPKPFTKKIGTRDAYKQNSRCIGSFGRFKFFP